MKFLEEKVQVHSHVKITKEEIKDLFTITSSERERGYAVCKASGYSQSKARQHFGFENMNYHSSMVQDSIQEAQDIVSAYDSLAECQSKALVECFGFSESSLDYSDSGHDSSEDSTSSELEMNESTSTDKSVNVNEGALLELLEVSK